MNSSPLFNTGIWGLSLAFLFYIVVYFVCRVIQERRFFFWRRDSITPSSVKESIDNLPAGILYYYPGGMVKLCNLRMEDICRMLTGKALTDAEGFMSKVNTDDYCLALPDNTFVSFVKKEISIEGRTLYEVIASDITKEVLLNRKLDKRKEEVEQLNSRLRILSDSIKYMSIEREALDMKVKIHDSLGQILLTVKRAIVSEDSIDLSNLKKEWLSNIKMMQEGRKLESWQEPFFTAPVRFDNIGVRLEIEGKLPKEDLLDRVIATALNVHATNVLRHAHGTAVKVAVSRHANMYVLQFTNDGDAPVDEIREGGGLSNLRREIEQIGGGMKIDSKPHFVMRLFLPATPRNK